MLLQHEHTTKWLTNKFLFSDNFHKFEISNLILISLKLKKIFCLSHHCRRFEKVLVV